MCQQCKGRGTVCVLVAHGTPCLGPVTRAGCGALCPSVGRGCYGCFGPVGGANTQRAGRAAARAGHGARRRVAALLHLLHGQRGVRASSGHAPGAGRCCPDGGGAVTPADERRRTVSVEGLARVEGEGSLRVEVRDGRVEDVELHIFEPPRFFEAFLRGRRATEAPDLTARICGICPVAYQMSACSAVEDALGDRRSGAASPTCVASSTAVNGCRATRCTSTCSMPPTSSAARTRCEMAQLHRPAFERGLALKKMGNRIMETIGGRAIHPVNVKVGGFYRAPSRAEVAALAGPLHRCPRPRRWPPSNGWRASTSPTCTATTASWPCASPVAIPSSRAASPRRTAWTSPRPALPIWWSRSTWPVRRRCTPGSRTGSST